MSYFTPNQMTDKITSEMLPQIVVDLILASTSKIGRFKLPVQNLNGNFGFDGEVEIHDDFKCCMPIPPGKYVFEQSVSSNIERKANDDYNKRKEQGNKNTTYAFITTQIFNKSGEWIEEKKQDTDFPWKDLLCISQSDLHLWFLRCPSVSIKWSEKWGIPNDLYTLESVWKRWDMAFEQKIPCELICALGYKTENTEKNKNLLLNFINDDRKKLIITAASVEEARLYIAAVLNMEKKYQDTQLPEDDANDKITYKIQNLIDKILCIDSKESFDKLPLEQFEGTIFITPLQDADVINKAVNNSIKVVQVLRTTNTRENIDIELPIRIKQDDFCHALQKQGWITEEIVTIARNSGRNVSTLRSVLSHEPQDWIKNIQDELIAALVVGGWSSEFERDKEVMCKLSGCSSYAEFTNKLKQFLNKENSPVQHEAPYYRTISSFSVFPVLLENITLEFIKNYQDICIDILSLNDNIKILPESHQLLAQMKGTVNGFSPLLRKSMADSLIHLSMLYKDNPAVADEIVGKVCTGSIERWKSIAPFVMELAEASPSVFLDKFEDFLNTSTIEELQLLVNESKGIMEDYGAYTSILFALELLAWEEQYLEKVTNILFKLIPIWNNIPTNVTNKPLFTLSEIFCLWFPQTNASVEKRNAIINRASKKYQKECLDLIIKLLPPHSAVTSKPKSKWRWKDCSETNGIDDELRNIEYNIGFNFLVTLSLSLPYLSIDLILKLIQSAINGYLSKEKITDFYVKLETVLGNGENSIKIWNAIREIIVQTEKYGGKGTNISALELLKSIYDKFFPENMYDMYVHYFYDYEHCLETVDNSDWYTKLDSRIAAKQKEAVKLIYGEEGMTGLITFLERLSKVADSSYNHFLADTFSNILEPIMNLNEYEINSFVSTSFSSEISLKYKSEIFKCYIKRFHDNSLTTAYEFARSVSEDFFINYLLLLPKNDHVLVMIDKESEYIQSQYWKKVDVRCFDSYQPHQTIINKLVNFSNYSDAITLLAYFYTDVNDFDIILKTLEGMANDSLLHNERYAINILLNRIEPTNDEENRQLVLLEWKYYAILEITPKRLYKELAKNPSLFLEFISLCFKSSKDDDSKKEFPLANKAYDLIAVTPLNNAPLLQAFRGDSGELNFEQLHKWFLELKTISNEKGYEDVALSIAGAHLAYSGKVSGYEYISHRGVDISSDLCEIFPELPMIELLNEKEFGKLRDSYKISFFNRHGSWSGSGVLHYTNLKSKIEENLSKIDLKYDIFCDMLRELAKEADARIKWSIKQEKHSDMGA